MGGCILESLSGILWGIAIIAFLGLFVVPPSERRFAWDVVIACAGWAVILSWIAKRRSRPEK